MTDFETPPPDIQRDRWGRPLVVPPAGGKAVPYTRCTTYIDCLDDKFNLQKWQQRMVAVGIAQRPDLHLAISSCASDPDNNKRQLDDLCDSAREAAAASSKATVGTALHALTERIDRGLDVGVVPSTYQRHLDNYTQATTALTAVHIEEFMVNDPLQIGGTPDRLSTITGEEGLFVVDLKTGPSTLKYGAGKVAMQMAVYAHSQRYDPASGDRTAIDGLRTDRGLVIALDAQTGDCSLHWVDLTDAWEAVDLATQVRQWRKRRATDFLNTWTPPATTNRPTQQDLTIDAALDQAIAAATTVDELLELWGEADRRGRWHDHHTRAAATRKAELLNQTTGQASA